MRYSRYDEMKGIKNSFINISNWDFKLLSAVKGSLNISDKIKPSNSNNVGEEWVQ